MILLGIHPLLQTIALSLAFYNLWLGRQRAVSLHFGRVDKFERDRHVLVGSLSLMMMLGGVADGMIMVTRYLQGSVLQTMHGQVALIALPFLYFGLFSGFYLYSNPARRKFLPAIHGINNLLVLFFGLIQLYTGIKYFLALAA